MNQATELSHLDESKRENAEKQEINFRSCLTFVASKLTSFVPIVTWLPHYNVNEDLFHDFVAGVNVGIMAVPQGMAYGNLAGLRPVNGLYSCFFAPLGYLLFGNSKHVAIGVFAVVSMMIGNLLNTLTENTVENYPLRVEIASTVTLTAGLIQVVMAVFRLDYFTTYMSDQLISGYTTGAAIHSLVSQVDKLFGVRIANRTSWFMIPKKLYDLVISVAVRKEANFVTLALSSVCFLFLIFTREVVNPRLGKCCRGLIPFELMLVGGTVLCSYAFSFSEKHGVLVVGYIPSSFPTPVLPNGKYFPDIWLDSVFIAIICYTFLISMGKVYARKHNYRLDSRQELYALGFASLLSSFFPVYPTGASLSRSAVCEMSGARTQLYVLFTSILLALVIFWVGPLMEQLPVCVLSCIVIVSLKSLFLHCTELPRLWRFSKFDFAIWMVSCVSTLISDPTLGLLISLGVTILAVTLRDQWPVICQITSTSNFQTFRNFETQLGLSSLPPDTVIVRFSGSLLFANCERFKEKLHKTFDSLLPLHWHAQKSIYEPMNSGELTFSWNSRPCVIVDCEAIPFIDTRGSETLYAAYQTACEMKIGLIFANLSESILDAPTVANALTEVPIEHIFPTVKEAVVFIYQEKNNNTSV